MKRILFVDDEPHVLEALSAALRSKRHEWAICFAHSGPEGLQVMRQAPVDVVVSDMRMPGMDGATFLDLVRGEHPRAARVVLSGHADRRSVVRALGVAHQFLSKPCPPERVIAVLMRTLALQWTVTHEGMRGFLSRLTAVPPLDELRPSLEQLLMVHDADAPEILRLVEQDIPLAMKLIQLANTLGAGPAPPVMSLENAVRTLGLEAVRGLAFSSRTARDLELMPEIPRLSWSGLYDRALLTGRIARRLSRDPQLGQAAFTAALLADIGTWIMALCWPGLYGQVAQVSIDRSQSEAELSIFGFTHADAGAFLLGLWGFPTEMVEAVAYHHCPGSLPGGAKPLVTAVHVADVLTGEMLSPGGEVVPASLDRAVLNDPELWPLPSTWWQIAREEAELPQSSARVGSASDVHRPTGSPAQ